MSKLPYHFDAHAGLDTDAVRACLAERGYAVLRNLFAPDLVADAARRIEAYARNPAIAGVPGYTKVDHPKRLFSPFAIGGPLVDLTLDERVFDIVEAYMESECVLAETNVKIDESVGYEYFAIHADFAVGWRKDAIKGTPLTDDELKFPVGVGGAIYLHDTTEGAFSYCEGTHTLRAPHGQVLAKYPDDERQAILERKVRLEGQAGDFVIFDDRGFHGPDQPSRSQRTVILVDYYRVETFGYMQVSPMAVWTSDLGRLTPRQMRVLGVGADYMIPPEEYMGTRFRRNRMYGLVRFLIEHAYTVDHLKQKAKRLIRGAPQA